MAPAARLFGRDPLRQPASVSGRVGGGADGTPEPDFAGQVELAFGTLKATSAAAGCCFGDIVDVTGVQRAPGHQFATIMAVKNRVFAEPPHPTWTAVGVARLAGFGIEIRVIARSPAGTSPVASVDVRRRCWLGSHPMKDRQPSCDSNLTRVESPGPSDLPWPLSWHSPGFEKKIRAPCKFPFAPTITGRIRPP
jgi:enamine deaminase RidA (YjgF/YER057c/UK114 family)